MNRTTVAFVLKGYPRLSETFIAQEILALERRGLNLMIVSLRFPTDKKVHPVNRAIKAAVKYLPEYVYQEPWRVLTRWWRARRLAGYRDARRCFLRDLRRDRTPNRLRRFAQALVLADELPASITHIHAHFLHTPASVARYAAIMRKLPWSCSAHAKDIYTISDWEKREKLADCAWLVTCTAFNAEFLASLAPDRDRVELVYHGLDLSRFDNPKHSSANRSRRNGSDANDPVVIISVGRAVAKKGYDDLLNALSRLPSQRHWRFEHIGGGPLLDTLKKQSHSLGLDQQIVWHGPMDQTEVIARYRTADIFVLPSRITADGDRDGLPNVLMEAQSQGLVCVATNVSGIPELINHDRTGVLVDSESVNQLSDALDRLIQQPDLRSQLGDAGERRVRTEFSMTGGIDQLARKFKIRAEVSADS